MTATHAKLLYASTEESADALYFAGFFVPDPVILMQVGRTRLGVFSRLEYGRAQKQSSLDAILPYEDLIARAKKTCKVARPGPAEIIRLLAEDRGLTSFHVPENFPAGLALRLIKAGLEVQPIEGAFFPQRETKTATEAEAIREGNRVAAVGIAAVRQALESSEIRGDELWLKGKRLTSERLRTLIQLACMEEGGLANHVIAAGGDQACDPHAVGEGPLKANELIIVDVFPRIMRSGYHGDMTRTFLKGKASTAQKKLVATVHQAQRAALAGLKAGVNGKTIHAEVDRVFKLAGYVTGQSRGVWEGFIHSTGHGLGLEIHESPRLSPVGDRLKRGVVVTVEPGLYYPGLGGCRIEDVVQVLDDGYDLLSEAPYEWEIA